MVNKAGRNKINATVLCSAKKAETDSVFKKISAEFIIVINRITDIKMPEKKPVNVYFKLNFCCLLSTVKRFYFKMLIYKKKSIINKKDNRFRLSFF